MIDDDIQLVESYKNGNKSSLETLYLKYKKKILRIIWYYVNNIEDAEDILQSLFLKLIDKIGKYKVYNNIQFRTWLFRVAINTAKDHLKMKKPVLNIEKISEIRDVKKGIAEELEMKESLLKIRKCIFELPLKYREVISMIFLENMKYEDVARILNRPVGTIKSRSNYAVNLLKKKMGVKRQ